MIRMIAMIVCLVRATLVGAGLVVGAVAGSVGAWSLAHQPLSLVAEAVVALVRGADPVAPMSLQDLLAGGCAGVLVGCAAWLDLVVGLLVASHLVRLIAGDGPAVAALSRAAARTCPAAVRGLVAGCLGMAVAVGVAAPTVAGQAPVPPAGDAGRLSGLPLPDRTTGTMTPVAMPRARTRQVPRVVVVRPGDSLWSIAARLVRPVTPRPADATVVRAWHRLYRANAERIGSDPDLVLPGTRLTCPPPDVLERKDPP